jgi:hypothetical protein
VHGTLDVPGAPLGGFSHIEDLDAVALLVGLAWFHRLASSVRHDGSQRAVDPLPRVAPVPFRSA